MSLQPTPEGAVPLHIIVPFVSVQEGVKPSDFWEIPLLEAAEHRSQRSDGFPSQMITKAVAGSGCKAPSHARHEKRSWACQCCQELAIPWHAASDPRYGLRLEGVIAPLN